VLVGVVPANAAYFGGYEGAKALLAARRARRRGDGDRGGGGGGSGGNPQPPPLLSLDDVVVGGAAQLLAGVVYTPVDIVKERLQVQSIMAGATGGGGPAAASVGAAGVVRRLLAERGAAGLFRGYWATNAVWLPWNMLYIAGYECSKRVAAQWIGEQAGGGGGGSSSSSAAAPPANLPAWCVALCSASAAAAAAVVTHPADVIKTRLQVLPGGGGGAGSGRVGAGNGGAWACLSSLARVEGARALWSGLGPRVANIAPGCALSWALYEQVKRVLPGGGGGGGG
jgi:solute carrier family 25 citrate transporter 1